MKKQPLVRGKVRCVHHGAGGSGFGFAAGRKSYSLF